MPDMHTEPNDERNYLLDNVVVLGKSKFNTENAAYPREALREPSLVVSSSPTNAKAIDSLVNTGDKGNSQSLNTDSCLYRDV